MSRVRGKGKMELKLIVRKLETRLEASGCRLE